MNGLPDERIEAYGNIKRAIMQRHLWAVFDWATKRRPPTFKSEDEKLQAARFAIQHKVAALVKRLALSQEDIRALPNTVQPLLDAKTVPADYDPKNGLSPYLPPNLFDSDGPWVSLRPSRQGLPAALHSDSEEWRSAFLVLMRLPGDRRETLDYINRLNQVRGLAHTKEREFTQDPQQPKLPVGSQFAIVQRAMLISDQRQLTLSPLVYSIQLRSQITYEFKTLSLPTFLVAKLVQ